MPVCVKQYSSVAIKFQLLVLKCIIASHAVASLWVNTSMAGEVVPGRYDRVFDVMFHFAYRKFSNKGAGRVGKEMPF